MYQCCQSPLWGEGRPSITYRGSPKEEMDHGNGDKCPVSLRIGCIKFSQWCT